MKDFKDYFIEFKHGCAYDVIEFYKVIENIIKNYGVSKYNIKETYFVDFDNHKIDNIFHIELYQIGREQMETIVKNIKTVHKLQLDITVTEVTTIMEKV